MRNEYSYGRYDPQPVNPNRNTCPAKGYWLNEAIEQKNPRLSIALADSVELIYSKLDEMLINLTSLN